ncbi:hypothetical protein MNV49_000874 [Pseudohyphozyma bogoriensis]|nr:hypothetical protein MNV49_000874 [Pseudohyphozyma bogoriensis]
MSLATANPPSTVSTLAETPATLTAEKKELELAEGLEKEGAAGPGLQGYREGGWQGWLNVAGSFFVTFSTFGYANRHVHFTSGTADLAEGPTADMLFWRGTVLACYYELHRFPNETSSNIAWIGSIQQCMLFSMGVIVGPLFDAGYFSLFMTSLATTYWQTLLAQGICMGIGQGIVFLPAISILGHYFVKRRSLAMGLCVTGSSFGGLCTPIMMNRLFQSIGFEAGVRASGYLVLGCLFTANVVMRPRLPPKKRAPGEKKLNPFTFFKELKYCLATAGAFCIAWGMFLPFFYLQVYTEAYNLPKGISEYSLAMLNAASSFGRVIPNAMGDYYGPLNTVIPCLAATAILCFAMFGAKTSAGAVVFALLYGFCSGGYASLLAPVFVSMSRQPSEMGARMGIAFLFVGIAALTGTPISGALLARGNGSFVGPIVFSGLVVSIGCVLMTAARMLQAKEKGHWRV